MGKMNGVLMYFLPTWHRPGPCPSDDMKLLRTTLPHKTLRNPRLMAALAPVLHLHCNQGVSNAPMPQRAGTAYTYVNNCRIRCHTPPRT